MRYRCKFISLAVNMGRGYYVVSAGASGAIFGVVGGLVYAVAVNRGRLEDLEYTTANDTCGRNSGITGLRAQESIMLRMWAAC